MNVSTCLSLVLGPALASCALAQGAALTVDLGAVRTPGTTSPWGLFFEEINHAGDGGLYAELVRNRDFEERDPLSGWRLVGGDGDVAVDTEGPYSATNAHYLKLTARPGGAAVANEGYWGISVEPGAVYDLSFVARTEDGGAVIARLEHPSGAVAAEARVGRIGDAWGRHKAMLGPVPEGAPTSGLRLTLAVTRPGIYGFDTVSLFPRETFAGRPNGLRRDLAQKLADMRPRFVRFPGGCFVEGDVLANATRWKTTVGDIAERPGHWNLWGYHSTDGLGMLEYLELCEDIGSEPLFVVNCGMAHGDVVPMDKLDEWVQDALDGIEYANGSTDTEWGALRAAHGHPKPFGLRLVEIGNENGGPAYEERYARFYTAIKERFPEVTCIANVPVKSAPMDIVDEHYYSSPDWFAGQYSRYDDYPRTGPLIYVGEYACTQGCGQGNLAAALGEAVFMLGMERNSDVVTMASYAPLFVNVRNRAWNPDAILFDGARSAGTPSYWTQLMFGQTALAEIASTELTSPPDEWKPNGAIGVGTWQTQAEYKDIVVRKGEQVLYRSDFASNADGWRPVEGDWALADGAWRQGGLGTNARSLVGDPSWTDYTLELKARKIGGAEGFLILFHARDERQHVWWNIGGWGNTKHAVERVGGGPITPYVPGSIQAGRWYDIRIELEGPAIRCFLDGELVHEARESGPLTAAAGAGRDRQGNIIVRVVNRGSRPLDLPIRLEGLRGALEPTGTAVVLTGNGPDDENSLTEPGRVAPVELPVTGVSPSFRYTFAPDSLTVLTLKER